jgi:molybdate transport system substrate-binding protein
VSAVRRIWIDGRFQAGAAVIALAATAAVMVNRAPKHEPALRVAAAADLSRAFAEVADVWVRAGHERPVFTFGSTGLLAKQIEQGAPFDVFAAANVEFVDDVTARGACDVSTRALYARGRIVVYTPRRPGSRPVRLEELASADIQRVAIAQPEHAPYGRAAKQALERKGLWEAVKPKLVYGENVLQTMQYAVTGNADAAIIALSLAVARDGQFVPIEPALHDPIDQALVVCGRDRRAAAGAEFVRFLGSPAGREVMTRYGFLLPGEVLGEGGALPQANVAPSSPLTPL